MAAHGKPVAVQLSPDLFLDGLGKFTRSQPADSLLSIPKSGFLDLPAEVKTFLDGKKLIDVRENGILKRIADFAGVSEQTRDFVKDVFELATNIGSVIGYAQAAMQILEMLGVFGEDETQAALKRIEKRVEQLFSLTFAGIQDAKVSAVREQLSKVRPAGDVLVDVLKYPQPPPPEARDRLFGALKDAMAAYDFLIGAEVQNMPFRWPEFPAQLNCEWWIVKSRHADPAAPVPDLCTLQDGMLRYDYRLYVPAVIETVTTLLGIYKAIDPAYRTTGRFREELRRILGAFSTFVINMTACVQWTRDYDLMTDRYYQPLAHGYPVGAVDVCTGANAVDPNWKEGVVSQPPPPEAGELEPPVVVNADDVLERGRLEREKAWISVFASSAIPEMLQLERRLAELASPPTTSETVSVTGHRSGTRTFVADQPYELAKSLGCDGKTFTAQVHDVQREWRIESPLQPSYYADQYAIPYDFYIEALSTTDPINQAWALLSRQRLSPGEGAATLETAQKFDWLVLAAPTVLPFEPGKKAVVKRLASGVRPKVLDIAPGLMLKRPVDSVANPASLYYDAADNEGQVANEHHGSITIDYTLSVTDGHVSVELRNRPADGSFIQVFFVIEETPRPVPEPIPPIRTAFEISAVGREYHLPQEYFDHAEQCEAKTAEIVAWIKGYAYTHKPGLPIPQWDPARFDSVEAYVQAVHQVDAGAVPAALLTASALERIRAVR